MTASLLVACGGGNDDAADDGAAGAGSIDVSGAPARPAFGLVTATVAASLAADPEVTVIDVRTPAEYAEGHLAGSTLIDIGSSTFADEIAALDPAGNYLVYCRSGNRSAQAVAVMRDLGVTQVWDMEGGIGEWTAAGLPLET